MRVSNECKWLCVSSHFVPPNQVLVIVQLVVLMIRYCSRQLWISLIFGEQVKLAIHERKVIKNQSPARGEKATTYDASTFNCIQNMGIFGMVKKYFGKNRSKKNFLHFFTLISWFVHFDGQTRIYGYFTPNGRWFWQTKRYDNHVLSQWIWSHARIAVLLFTRDCF